MARLSKEARASIFGRPGQVDRVVVATPWGIRVQCHRLIRDVFHDACTEAAKLAWQPRRIDSYNYRTIRGSKEPSLHGYALAFDFFSTPPSVPPPGGVWHPDDTVPPEFAECFTRRGFTWGATFDREDWPHIEWAAGLPSHTATETHPAPAGPHQEDDMATAAQQYAAAQSIVTGLYEAAGVLPSVQDFNYWTALFVLSDDPHGLAETFRAKVHK